MRRMIAGKDWAKEPEISGIELMQMVEADRRWFLDNPDIWRPVYNRDVYLNMAHPKNGGGLVLELAKRGKGKNNG